MTELEQKLLFAERYLRNKRNDALMIVGNIMGRAVIDVDPMVVINNANSWVNDPIVIAEMKRIENLPPDDSALIFKLQTMIDECMNRGEEKAAMDGMKLLLTSRGLLKGSEKDDGKGGHDLKRLMEMVIDPANTGG